MIHQKKSRSIFAALAAGGLLLLWMTVEAKGVKDAPKSGLEEVLSLGGLSDDRLLMWVGLAVDPVGNMIVTDALDYSIKIFDSQGRLVRKVGRDGGGQAKFQALRDVGLSKSAVYVTDQNDPRIFVFSTQLKFQRALPLSRAISCLRVLPDDTLAAACLTLKKGERALIWLADGQGRTLQEIPYGTDLDNPACDRASFAFLGQDLILAYNFKDRVERLDRKGRRLWSKSLFHLKDVPMRSLLGVKLPQKFIYKDVAVDSAGRSYILGGGLAEHPSRDVYVLSPEGQILATLTLPDKSHCLVIDGQDFLYSRADEGLTIKKFKVHLPSDGRLSKSKGSRP